MIQLSPKNGLEGAGRLAAVVLASVALGGCVPTPAQRQLVARAAAFERDASLSSAAPIPSELQDIAERVCGPALSMAARHYVGMLEVGEDALLARIHLIRAARRSIDIQSFIWVDDAVGRLVFDELLQAARRGVRVRVLVDHFCKMGDPFVLARGASAHVNLEIRIYNPVSDRLNNSIADYIGTAATRFRLLNQRMHNKVVVIDGRIGITGGRNVENRYYDWDPCFNFRDRDVLVIGPVAAAMEDSFEEYWEHPLARPALELIDVSEALLHSLRDDAVELPGLRTSGLEDLLRAASARDIVSSHGRLALLPVGRVEFVADRPDKVARGSRRGLITDRLEDIVAAAEVEVVTQTPYMLMSADSLGMLRKLRRRKPDIRLVYSTNSLAATDAFYVYALSFKDRRLHVKELGLEIHELKPSPQDIRQMIPAYELLHSGQRAGAPEFETMYSGLVPNTAQEPRVCIHAKSFVVDGWVSFVGSHNFDPRSNRLNTECGLLVWDTQVAAVLRDGILRDSAPRNSWVLGQRRGVPLVSDASDAVAAISRALPVMDIWPFRKSTSYALRHGKTPVAPGHADFHERYRDVGWFPEAGLSSEQLLTRLIAAFGGWGKSLM